jgi:type I restriction enzyme S subunit
MKIMKDKPNIVPKLRFPEFRDAEGWEPKRLGLALKFQAGFPFPSSGFNDARKGLRLIRNRDLRSDDIVKFYSEEFDPNYVVNNGDVLVGMDGDFTPTVWEKGEALLNQRVGRILPRGDNDHRFLLYLLTLCLKGIEEATARTTVKHLSHSAVEDKHEPLPSPAEQQKIAECLSSVDALIAAQARKLDALKTHKKGLMQKLFPREGETTPRLRFPEFQNAGEWEYLELDSYLLGHSERVSSNTELPIYSSTRNGLKSQKDYFNDRELENDGEYGVVPEGYFVYRHMSDDGTFKFNINKTGGKIAVSKEYPVFTTIDLHSEFLLHLLNDGGGFKEFALAQKKGGTRTRLYLKVLRTWKALLPPLPEQQRIADCLTSLDDLIAAHTQKLEALKTHKKGLMQQLFPSPEESNP